MECQALEAKICNLIHDYLLKVNLTDTSWEKEIPLKWSEEIKYLFHLLQVQSEQENYYWQFCTLKVYKSHFDRNKDSFLSTNIDAIETDFLEVELKAINFQLEAGTELLFQNFWINYPIKLRLVVDDEQFQNFQYSQRAKKKFLVNLIDQDKSLQSSVSDDSKIEDSFALRITYLNELGILDYLQEKYPEISNNQIAKLVAKFTGVGLSTTQPSVNAVMNENTNSKSYPLSDLNKQKVRQSLNEIGLDLQS